MSSGTFKEIVFKLLISAVVGITIFSALGCGAAVDEAGWSTVGPGGGLVSVPGDDSIYRNGWKTCGRYRVAIDDRVKLREWMSEDDIESFQESVRDAVGMWNQALGFELITEVEDAVCTKSDINVRVDISGFMDSLQEAGVPGPIGLALYGLGGECSCSVSVATLAAASASLHVHEIGHCLGLGHSKDQKSIMFDKYEGGSMSVEMVGAVSAGIDHGLQGPDTVAKPGCEVLP